MAGTAPAQQHYPNLHPYSQSNGHSKTHSPPLQHSPFSNTPTPEPAASPKMASTTGNTMAGKGRTLLSWSNPRASALTYTAIVTLILATRFVPVLKYILKGTYIIMGTTALGEMVGQKVFGEGVATKIKPKKYYTIPRETLDSVIENLYELANFVVIEFQKVVFAENVEVTIGTFLAALAGYFLVKITPTWALALLTTTLVFFAPLVYIQNQSLIDHHLENTQALLNQKTNEVRDIANQHTSKAMEASQSALKEYSAKASEMIGGAKKAAVENGVVTKETADKLPGDGGGGVAGSPAVEVKKEDFPAAPKTEPAPPTTHDGTVEEKEPLLA